MQGLIRVRRTQFIALGVAAIALLGWAFTQSTSANASSKNRAELHSSASSGVNVAAAKALVAPYVGNPSPFPTNTLLKRRPSAGSKVVFMDAGTTTTALEWSVLVQAAKVMGVKVVRVAAGESASSISAAFDSVVAMKPAGVISIAIDPDEYGQQMKELRAEHVPVIGSAIEDGAKYGFSGPISYGPSDVRRVGRLVGAWAVARTDGKVKQFALYSVPELAFSAAYIAAAKSEIHSLCSSCSERVVDIPVSEIGNGASEAIVSDLQGHPATGYAILATDELADGLPQALKTAGLSVKTIGAAPGPENLEQVKAGEEDATLGVDLEEQMWAALDQWARERIHQPLTGAEAQGELVMEFLTKPAITFNPADGWVGYPNLPQRFSKLWGK